METIVLGTMGSAVLQTPLAESLRYNAPGNLCSWRPLNAALVEYYRCPEILAGFKLVGQLSPDAGYFRFGQNSICYGRSTSGVRTRQPQSAPYDVSRDVGHMGETALLPFDPNEIIANLRMERYASQYRQAALGRVGRHLRNFYYLLRPALHVSVRQWLQRAYLRDWRQLTFPRWPVDTTVEDLHQELLLRAMKASNVQRVPFIWFWPKGASGCLTMTHDVESKYGLKFCPQLMDMDDSFGFKASFQVVPAGRYHLDGSYVAAIRGRGFEMNLQDLSHDGHLFRQRDEFLERAREINAYAELYQARGFRAAVLYRNPEWLDALHFSFDMSIPNVAHLDPQRGGCCTVMPYFIGDMVEIPLTTVQDYSLFHLLGDYSLDTWKTQAEIILSKNGLLSFLVHPDYVIEKKGRAIYLELLHYLRDLVSQRGLWCALPGEIDQWWRARSGMKLARRGEDWEIEGEGAERATLAFAVLAGDHLEYQIHTN